MIPPSKSITISYKQWASSEQNMKVLVLGFIALDTWPCSSELLLLVFEVVYMWCWHNSHPTCSFLRNAAVWCLHSNQLPSVPFGNVSHTPLVKLKSLHFRHVSSFMNRSSGVGWVAGMGEAKQAVGTRWRHPCPSLVCTSMSKSNLKHSRAKLHFKLLMCKLPEFLVV